MDAPNRSVFAQPKQTPAISAHSQGQQAVQSTTRTSQRELLAPAPSDDIDYKAYVLAQQALGSKSLPKSQWQLMFRHQRMMNEL